MTGAILDGCISLACVFHSHVLVSSWLFPSCRIDLNSSGTLLLLLAPLPAPVFLLFGRKLLFIWSAVLLIRIKMFDAKTTSSRRLRHFVFIWKTVRDDVTPAVRFAHLFHLPRSGRLHSGITHVNARRWLLIDNQSPSTDTTPSFFLSLSLPHSLSLPPFYFSIRSVFISILFSLKRDGSCCSKADRRESSGIAKRDELFFFFTWERVYHFPDISCPQLFFGHCV